LVIPDLRGHGKSTNPSNIFRHANSAQDIYALMDELDIKKFKAIGASSGGMTLVHMATMDSTRIISMVLVGATSYSGKLNREIQKNTTFEKIPEAWLSELRNHHPGGDDQIKRILNQFNSMAEVYDDMNFTTPYLSQIKCPTLIIHGGKDEYFPIEIPVEMAEAIPNSFLWIIPNGGHLPIWDALWADKFLEVSKLFLNDKLK
jgi:pimeloyl-ACP methyl ester carboxylesterase